MNGNHYSLLDLVEIRCKETDELLDVCNVVQTSDTGPNFLDHKVAFYNSLPGESTASISKAFLIRQGIADITELMVELFRLRLRSGHNNSGENVPRAALVKKLRVCQLIGNRLARRLAGLMGSYAAAEGMVSFDANRFNLAELHGMMAELRFQIDRAKSTKKASSSTTGRNESPSHRGPLSAVMAGRAAQ